MSRPKRLSILPALMSLSLVFGCSLIFPPLLPQPSEVELEHWPAESVNGDCARLRIGDLTLLGDEQAPVGEQVWVESEKYGRLTPVWPYGWTGWFAPEIQIRDREGALVLSEGDNFHAGGSRFPEGTAQICDINGEVVL